MGGNNALVLQAKSDKIQLGLCDGVGVGFSDEKIDITLAVARSFHIQPFTHDFLLVVRTKRRTHFQQVGMNPITENIGMLRFTMVMVTSRIDISDNGINGQFGRRAHPRNTSKSQE